MTPEINKLATLTVGLFGTCGKSTWRDAFMAAYAERGIAYFNPQVDNWTPELADVEAWHLANDQLILFPVTDETYAAGSLAETGFSVATAQRLNSTRFVVLYVAPEVNADLKLANPEAANDSKRARKLVLAHLAHAANPNVFLVQSLEEMLAVSLRIYAALDLLSGAREVNTWRSTLSPQAWNELVRAKVLAEPADVAAVAEDVSNTPGAIAA